MNLKHRKKTPQKRKHFPFEVELNIGQIEQFDFGYDVKCLLI